MDFVCVNGRLVSGNQPVLTAQNRGFKYGDGVFETMKIYKGQIRLAALHFERLFLSLKLLQIHPAFDQEQLGTYIRELCERNGCSQLGRVRLAVYRTDQNAAGFIIEALPLTEETNSWNNKGYVIDLHPYVRKAQDAFANLKSANFLPYVLADLHAKEKGFDDCVVLNGANRICDTSKANIFLIKNREVFTPALHQGCVNGVMRRFLIDEIKKMGYRVHQEELSETDLLEAEEVFLTNAVYGLRWVSTFKKQTYAHNLSAAIYEQVIAALYK